MTEAAAPHEPELSGQQRALVEALGERQELVSFYLGSLHVLGDDLNPDRMAQSAHSIREFIEKLPKYFDVPAERGATSLKAEANNLATSWISARKNSSCHEDGMWSGELDGPLRKFLTRAAKFFQWLEAERPPRLEEARGFLRSTDPSPYPLPDRIERLRVEEWNTYRDFFVGVAHHAQVDLTEYEAWLAAFEDFLLKQLVPRTFEDREDIRAMIKEAEARVNS